MHKLTILEAVKVITVSESTLRRDISTGKVSAEKDSKGRKVIDVSELVRVYGEVKGFETANDTEKKGDNSEVVVLLTEQVQDLKTQLAKSDAEKAEILKLANSLQKQNEVLILTTAEKKTGFIKRLQQMFTG